MLLASLGYTKLPSNYMQLSAENKQKLLFTNASSSPYSVSVIQGQQNPGTLESLKLLLVTHLAESFTNDSDEFGSKKTKLIHTYGSVAKVSFRVTHQTEYTGLFKSGALGIIRLSLAKIGPPFTPGLALKLLVDGEKSQNIFAMYSLDGQGENFNFFANSFETKIHDPEATVIKVLARRFKETLIELGSTHRDPTLQSATDVAQVTSDGSAVTKPVSPFSVIFEPNKRIEMSSQKGEFRIRLKDGLYSAGLVLYKVSVRGEEKGPKKALGEVVLESGFVANEYGDSKLYFQHNID